MIFNKNKIFNKKGFTLIELIVSISIMTIISTLVMANYKTGGKSAELNMAAQKIVTDIRRVQEFTMGMKEFDDGATIEYPEGGWGIRFSVNSGENDKYIIFADTDNDKKRIVVAENSQIINLPSDISFDAFDIDGNISRNFAYITFVAPDPDIFIGGANNENNSSLPTNNAKQIKITIKNKDGKTKDIVVNSFGLVEVD